MNRDRNRVAVARICGAWSASVVAIALLAGCGGSSGGAHNFCADQASAQTHLRAVLTQVDPPSKDDYSAIAGELRTLEIEAPEPAKTYLATMATGAEKAVNSGSGFLDDPAVTNAASQLTAYVNSNCS